jgi:ABC-type lipoprotein release transport system permease subunit
MFIVASFSIVSGLGSSMDRLTGTLDSEYCLVTMPGASGPELLPRSSFAGILSHAAVGAVAQATVRPSLDTVTVLSLVDDAGVLRERFAVQEGQVLVGTSVSLSGEITLEADGTESVTVLGQFSSGMFPSTWVLGHHALLMALMGADEELYNFAIVREMTAAEAAELREDGFCVQNMVGALDFLGDSVRELEDDALWVLLPSSFAIAVLAYSFIGSEISDRRHDIGILKTIGAGRSRVLQYLLLSSFIISALGGLLGLALGVVVSYAISTAASVHFTSVFVLEIEESLLAISFLATLLAGVAGALMPSLKMAFTLPVEDLKEAGQSS